MKKQLLISTLLMFALVGSLNCSYAQTKDDRELLKSLQNEKLINVIIDFSQAKIHGKSEADFVYLEDLNSLYDWTSLWEIDYKPNLVHDFMVVFTSKMLYNGYKVKFRNQVVSKYQIRLVVQFISPKGNVKMLVFVEDTELQRVLFNFEIIGQGGFSGSKVNLMGDGFKNAGKDLVKQMVYVFRKGKVRELNNRVVSEKSWPF